MLKDGKPYHTDALGMIDNLVEARDLIHALTKLFGDVLGLTVTGTAPIATLLQLEYPQEYAVIYQIIMSAHAVSCDEFDREILLKEGRLVRKDEQSDPSVPLSPDMEKLIKGLSENFSQEEGE